MCVGDGEASRKRNGPRNWASFLVLLWCSFFLESSTRLLLRRRLSGGSDVFQTHVAALLIFFPIVHGYVMMSAQGAACNYSRAGRRSTFSARACTRQRRVAQLPANERDSGSAPADVGGGVKQQDLNAALKASLRLEATRRPHASTARPRNHCAGAPSPSTAPRPRAPPWIKAPRARRLRVRTARKGSPPW